MITITFNNLRLTSSNRSRTDVYTYYFQIDSPEVIAYNNFVAMEFAEFEFGNDSDDDEFKMKAAESDFSFRVPNLDIWKKIRDALKNYTTKVDVMRNGFTLFTGVVDKNEIQGYFLNKIIKVTFTDAFATDEDLTNNDILSFADTHGHPLGAPSRNDQVISITEFMAKLLYEAYGSSYTLEYLTRLKYNVVNYGSFDTGTDPGGYYYLGRIGAYFGNLLNLSLYNYDFKTMIKTCCNTLSSYAVTGLYNKLWIIPFHNPGVMSKYIYPSIANFVDEPELYMLEGKKALKINCISSKIGLNDSVTWSNSFFPIDGANLRSSEISEINLLGNPNTIITNPPAADPIFKHISADINDRVNDIIGNSFQFFKRGYFESANTLPYLALSNLWDCISTAKEGYRMKLHGTDYDISNYFILPIDANKVYRTRKIKYNFRENTTELNIIELK